MMANWINGFRQKLANRFAGKVHSPVAPAGTVRGPGRGERGAVVNPVRTANAAEAANQNHFDQSAAGYDQRFKLSIEGACGRARFIRTHAQQPLPQGTALDLGCGTGNLTMALRVEGLAEKCIGLDISPAMIGIARQKAQAFTGCEFVVGTVNPLPFPDATFDLCVGDAVLHHILDVQACLAEVYRVLKPGGLATFNEPSRDGYAFFELMIRSVAGTGSRQDESIRQYLEFLQFVREHAGDRAALEAYPLPDKHVFSEMVLQHLATQSGFHRMRLVPALDAYPDLWPHGFQSVLTEIKAGPEMTQKLMQTAHWIETILGDVARQHFCLHQQVFLYKD